MNANKLRKLLRDIVQMYFAKATVLWSEGRNTQPKKPYITLKMASAGRDTHYTYEDDNGNPCGFIISKARLEVNLFTNGLIKLIPNASPLFINTAVGDLEDFCNFVTSDKVMDICDEHNITIMQSGDVMDVTALLDGVEHEYRAMVEFEVDYMQEVRGAYGVSTDYSSGDSEGEEKPAGFVPTPSGGRTEEQYNSEIGYFIEVETESEE